MFIFLCLVSDVTRVYLSVSCVKIDMVNIGHKTEKDRHGQHLTQETERQTRVTLKTRHRKIDTGSFCVLCPMLPVSIFLCLVFNVTYVYLSVSCVQCYAFIQIDTCNIGQKTQKDRHVYHWTQDTER
jgi:hypothetical protein